MKIVAVLPDGGTTPLLWLYEYKDSYRHPFLFREPIDLPAGSTWRGIAHGDIAAALRGEENIFYFVPGFRYLRALEKFIFGDTEFATGVTRAIIQERERGPLSGTLPGNGYQLTVDVFQEFGGRARVASWRLDLKRVGDPGTDTEWLIDDENRVSSVENLYKLSLNPKRQFRARDLAIAQDDLDLRLTAGSVFVSEVDQGTTAVLLLGRGVMRFHPAPDTERTQVRIFSGGDVLETGFDAAFIRLHPLDVDQLLTLAQLDTDENDR
jgi:hypothetical protein